MATTAEAKNTTAKKAATVFDDDGVKRPRVLIAGAGVIGSSIAYHLALKGFKAIIYDQVGVGCAASGKAGGFLGKGSAFFFFWLCSTSIINIHPHQRVVANSSLSPLVMPHVLWDVRVMI
jgi:hypothetical protein